MAEALFSTALIENLKVLFVGLLIYVIVFALLKKIQVLGDDDKINSLIALLSALIVSFTGVLTFTISYALNWFILIFIGIFFFITLLLFLGITFDGIASQMKNVGIMWGLVSLFALLFLGVLLQGFSSLNTLDDQQDFQQQGEFEDVNNQQISFSPNDGDGTVFGIDQEIFSAALFLAFIGIFVILIGQPPKN